MGKLAKAVAVSTSRLLFMIGFKGSSESRGKATDARWKEPLV